jgi:phosphate starvation-inducible membrane PsiE
VGGGEFQTTKVRLETLSIGLIVRFWRARNTSVSDHLVSAFLLNQLRSLMVTALIRETLHLFAVAVPRGKREKEKLNEIDFLEDFFI